MILLDGKGTAQEIKSEIAEEVKAMVQAGKRPPHLVAVLVGEHPASRSYVSNKVRSCEAVGFNSTIIQKEASISEEELLDVVQQLNTDDKVDGFIVQLPLPDHISEDKINLAIDPKKDVDGFHPVNFGLMAQNLPGFLPATPAGIVEMLKRYNIETSGKEVVVVGRSNIVGTPISVMLSRKAKPGNATVTICHSRTADLKSHTLRADILIAAIGRENFITADMVKEGAVVFDVGINRVDDASKKRGYRLVGDVAFETVKEKCSYITPVPGGVGPMTVVALLSNTLKAAKSKLDA